MKRKLIATLLCIALGFIISGNVVQAMSVAQPETYFDDLQEYRQNTYFRMDLPLFFVKWENVSWLGKFTGYSAYEDPPKTYLYHAGESYKKIVTLGIMHNPSSQETSQVADISDEMTSMLKIQPQGGSRCRIIRGPFEYLYNSSGELTHIRWKHGNAIFALSGNLEEYADDKHTVIGKLLSVSSIDFAVAWIVIVWNLIYTPLETALVFVAVSAIIPVIVIRRKQRKKLIETECTPE